MSTLRLFRLLLWVQWRSLLARVRGLRTRSPLLPFLLGTFIVGYLLLGYFLFYRGLRFVSAFPAVGALLSQRILFLVFGFFFVMLVFSNLVIGYSTLFKNRETNWFLTLPIRHPDIYRWKFLECVAVSSWALIFLSAPMMAAVGQVNMASPAFYFQVALTYLPFVAIPAVIGSALVLGLVALLSKPWAKKALVATTLFALAAILAFVHPAEAKDLNSSSEIRIFNQLLGHTRFSLNPFLPSAWMAQAVFSLSGGLGREGGYYFCLLLSNALMGVLLGFEVASRFFYDSWARAFSHRSERSMLKADTRRQARLRRGWVEAVLQSRPVAALVSRPVAALVLKDTRIFWRDPAQWSQVVIFFGLLTIYVLNLRNVTYDIQSKFWGTMISYLNLTACALTLSTLTTRFVFPQFSLEGRRLWILGLAPLGLPRVLMQKFWSACLAAMGVTVALMVASSAILHLGAWQVAYFAVAIALMTGALCGLAVGLGALFPNFKEENPSKIVSGFGGTLCLVGSFVYIVFFIALLALPASLPFTVPGMHGPERALIGVAANGLAAALSLAAASGPLVLACRRLRNMEF